MLENSNITQLCHVYDVFLIDVFICVLMGYLQCWVVIIGKPGFQTDFHNEILLITFGDN
jgi:hypothetical protein